MMRIKPFIFLFTLALVMSCLACTEERAAPVKPEDNPLYKDYRFSSDEKVIELGAPTPWSAVSHLIEVMKRDEILKQDLDRMGYSVRVYPFLKGDEIIYFIKKGALEGAIMGDVPTLAMAAEGRTRVVSLFHKGSVSLVTREVYRVRDLKGKRVAYPQGSIAHYYLLSLLDEKGLSASDIRHVPMNTSEMFEAIEQNRIDAFTTFEPTATIFTKIDPTLHIINRSFSTYGFFSLRKDVAAKHPRAAQAIVAAQFRAQAWLVESDRNVRRASRWVAEESEKLISLPLHKYLQELDSLCEEDLLGDMIDYAAVMKRDVLGADGALRKEFEFLKQHELLPRDSEWNEVLKNIDARALPEPLTDARPAVSKIRP
jgi:ABC-type nitrate/sulfonate/bicarbonate transport system substrate-binding protein